MWNGGGYKILMNWELGQYVESIKSASLQSAFIAHQSKGPIVYYFLEGAGVGF